MERRTLAGAAVTALVVVGGAAASRLIEGNAVAGVLFAGIAGGAVVGLLSKTPGHIGAGARAGGYGGAVGFGVFIAASGVLAVMAGDPSFLVFAVQRLLIGVLVVPLHTVLGAGTAAVGVRVRRAAGRETAL
ncbi:MAG: hypothetical protein ACI8UR_000924 [Natronomonas sp.]|jgi:hypothetical protein|uniref:hypothetical protein n=1 Tax=Natronomonas sp. TaxID=2184060 RepID=UPI003988DCA1